MIHLKIKSRLSKLQENSFQQLFDTNNKNVFNISLNIVQNTEDDITLEVYTELLVAARVQ